MKFLRNAALILFIFCPTLSLHANDEVMNQPMQGTTRSRYENDQVRDLEKGIAEDRDKIIKINREISGYRKTLAQAKKSKDAALANSIAAQITAKETEVKAIKNGINAKKDERNNILYGRVLWSPRRTKE